MSNDNRNIIFSTIGIFCLVGVLFALSQQQAVTFNENWDTEKQKFEVTSLKWNILQSSTNLKNTQVFIDKNCTTYQATVDTTGKIIIHIPLSEMQAMAQNERVFYTTVKAVANNVSDDYPFPLGFGLSKNFEYYWGSLTWVRVFTIVRADTVFISNTIDSYDPVSVKTLGESTYIIRSIFIDDKNVYESKLRWGAP